MDPYKVLGVSEGSVRTDKDFEKLRQRTKELYRSYVKKNRESDARKVEKAFEQIRQKFKGKDTSKEAAPRNEAAPQAAPDKDKASGQSGAAPPASTSAGAPESVPPRKRRGEEQNAESAKRRELIREKLAEKRKNPTAKEEDPEVVRRHEAIRQRLAEKRGGAVAPKPVDGEAQAPVANGNKEASADQTVAQPAIAPAHLPAPTILPTPTVLMKPKRSKEGLGKFCGLSKRRQKGIGVGQFIVCGQCGQSVERQSYRYCTEDEEGFVCPTCRIRGMDPFNVVKEDRGGFLKFALLQPPVVEKNVFNEAVLVFRRDFKKLKEWRKSGYNVEVRMCTLEDFKMHHVWPQSAEIQVNKRRAFKIEPPKKVGEKRRDAPENLSARLRPGINEFRVRFRDHNVQRFAFALVRSKPMTVREMCKLVPVISEDQCKQRVSDFLFSSMLDGCGAEVEFSFSDKLCLNCPITHCRMRTPARGRKCQHLQCFDLTAFLSTNKNIPVFNKRWACPVCDLDLRSAKEMFIDTFVMNIIANAEADVVEIAFDQNAAWTVSATAEPPSPTAEAQLAAESAEIELEETEARLPEGSPLPEDDDDGEVSEDGDDRIKSPVEVPGTSPPEGSPPVASPPPGASPIEGSPVPLASPSVGDESEAEEAKVRSDGEELSSKEVNDSGEQAQATKSAQAPAADFIDPMSDDNYIVVELPKPMGIVFEANISHGGVVVAAFGEGSAAAKHGRLKIGDQLVGVGGQCMKSRTFDACIDRIVADPNELTKLTVFRGKASDLYGASGAVEGRIEELLKKVVNGKLKPAPPMERKNQRRMAVESDGSANSEAEEDEGSFSDGSSAEGDTSLPDCITSCLEGEGLDEDLQKCVQILAELPFDGAPKRISADGVFPRSVMKACIRSNPIGWAEVAWRKKDWCKSARKSLADAANSRVDRLEGEEKQRQEIERQAALAALRQSCEEKLKADSGKPDGPLLRVEPSRIKFDGNRQAQMVLKNTNSGNVAFRIKTSAPQFIFVEPAAGIVKQGTHVVIQIMNTNRQNIIGSHDLKFLVQGTSTTSAELVPRERWAELEKKGSVFECSVPGKL